MIVLFNIYAAGECRIVLFCLIPFFIIGPAIVGSQKNNRILFWFFAIYFISFFPVIIEMVKFKIELKQAIMNSYLNNSFYSVLFSLLMAGYIDYCYSKAIKSLYHHILVWIFIGIIIMIGLFDILTILNINLNIFYLVFIFYNGLVTIYLKILSESKK